MNGITVFAVFTLLLWSRVVQSQNGDICLYSAALKRADCTPTPEFGDFRFSTIPNDLDGLVETIIMNDNEINSLYPGNLTYYTNLKNLELTNNLISEIPKGLVETPISLESLILDSNPLLEIDDEALVNMSNLTILSLKNTQLSSLTTEVLKGLTSLKELYLDGSSVSLVSGDLFSNTENIQTVSFANSKLVTLPYTLFDSIVNFPTVTISLAGNPWSCDCYLSFLKSLMNDDLGFPFDRDELTCRWPENHKGMKIEDIADDEFDCYSPTIISSPQDESILTNQSFSFNCEVDGAPFPDIVWIKDGAIVSFDDRVYLNNQFNGSLYWTNTILSDSGVYLCQASNVNGTDSSSNATLTVTEITCFDKSRSSHETDIDCGGIYCSPCNQAQACLIDRDCKGGLVCLYSHKLPSQLLYMSPNDPQAYTCEASEMPRELLNTRIQNGLPVDIFVFNFTVEAPIDSVSSSIGNAIAEQLSVPVSTLYNVRMSTVERLSPDSIPLVQIWFDLIKNSDGKEGYKKLLELIDSGEIQGTIRIIDNDSHYSIRLNL